MIKIFKYLKKKEWLFVTIGIAFVVMQVWLDLKLPDYMSTVTQLTQSPDSQMSDILLNGGYMLLCALGSMAASIVVGYFAAKVAATLSSRLREAMFKKTLSFSMEEINRFSTASLITRSTNDITQIQTTVAMGLQAIIKAPILAVWAIMKIAGKSWQWTAATGVAVIVIVLMLAILVILAVPKFQVTQKLTDKLNRITRENLLGIRVVRAYNAEKYQEEKFEGANTELTKVNTFVNKVMALMSPTMTLVMSGITLAIYWIGAYLIDTANMMDKITLFSDMVVFSSYSMQVIMAFMLLSMMFIMLPRATVSANRIMEVLETEVKIESGSKETNDDVETIEFKNVSFTYPDASDNVLHDINFSINKGETVAFIGGTGSGKTTLVNLIPRFYDTSEGEVLINGENVKQYDQKNLRKKIGYVSQKATLFSGTVTSNVSYGDNQEVISTENDIKEAVAIAQGTDFIEKMSDKYEGAIAQNGTNVSGGQKQRISIARAVARKPEVYIFDDSFSALDYKTDKALRNALHEEVGDATLLIVAQRIGTIKDADKIIVLDEGKIVGCGTHQELLQDCQVYQDIAYSQLSKEELEYGA
ncbi:MAG: ABC transporter ATP-binding protein [Coprobacillaceae bacterium]